MDPFRVFILAIQVSAGLLLVGTSIPLILKKVPPNIWYGFRVKQTLQDRDVWYKANAYAGKSLLGVGLVMVAGSLALFPVASINGRTYATVCIILTLASLTVSIMLTFRELGRITHPTDP